MADEGLARVVTERVEQEVSKIRDQMEREMRGRLEYIEEKVLKEYRSKLLAAFGTAVALALAALIYSTATASRKANEAVISLQSDIINKQKEIIKSDDAITRASVKFTEAEGTVGKAKIALETATANHAEAQARLKADQEGFEKAKRDYEELFLKVRTLVPQQFPSPRPEERPR